MIRVLAIDDEPLALQQLVAYIKKLDFLQLTAQCQSAIEARDILDREPVDAIFCDINMPDLSGMDFVRQLAVPPLIVFTTAYSEYAIEGYKVDAVDYLLKPFGFQDFQRAALKVRKRWEESTHQSSSLPPQPSALSPLPSALSPQPSAFSPLPSALSPQPSDVDDTIFVKTDYRMVRLSISDIRYVEGMSEYLRIYLDSQPKPIITLLSMKKMEEFLPAATFMRIHRSYIVNLNRVQEVNKNRVILSKPACLEASVSADDAETSLPIGENYRDAFNAFLSSRYLGK